MAKTNKETNEAIKKVSKLVGAMGNNQGKMVEDIFYNSLKAIKSKEGITLDGVTYDEIDKRVVLGNKSNQKEYDIILLNGQSIAIIEVKLKAHSNDLDQLSKKAINFKTLYKNYNKQNTYLYIALCLLMKRLFKKPKKKVMVYSL